MNAPYDLDLFSKVHAQYLDKDAALSPRKKFHFFSRLYLWSKNTEYKERMLPLKTEWMRSFPKVCERLSRARIIKYVKKEPKKSYRVDILTKYYHIKDYNKFFFRCLLDRTIFNDSLFEASVSSIDKSHLAAFRAAFMEDTHAVFALSTHAVNFITLSNYFFGDEVCPLSYEYFLNVGDREVLNEERDDLDARIYFYTHVIIGASRFYAERIADDALSYCREMVRRVEQIIESHYDTLSLDHKCEFLVCAHLCEYETVLQERIYHELVTSISPHPLFFKNIHNARSIRKHEATISSMEHTNVLALMAFVPKDLL
jgi:hypothetical protein